MCFNNIWSKNKGTINISYLNLRVHHISIMIINIFCAWILSNFGTLTISLLFSEMNLTLK